MSEGYTLYCNQGSGSMIVEAGFGVAGVPVRIVDVADADLGWNSKILNQLNPLGQAPTLVMPGGAVMTESAAMLLHVNDIAPQAGLVPPPEHPRRTAFLRWLVFMVSAIYPTFTYGDDPSRWLDGDKAAGAKLRTATDEHRKMLWRYLEGQIEGPWCLGETWSALDLYMPPMTFWRPHRAWFQAECPKLLAIGVNMESHSVYQRVLERNGLLKA